MAAKKTAAEQGLQQKMKVLAKLFDAGCKTEKDLKALTLPTILKIPGRDFRCAAAPSCRTGGSSARSRMFWSTSRRRATAS